MKKAYIIAAFALFAFVSCKQNEAAASDVEDYTMEDTTVVDDPALMDSTAAVSSTEGNSEVKLPDTISIKTTKVKTDNTSGKFALAGTKWKLVELNGRAVKNTTDKDFTLTLNSKTGKITGYAGCNSIMGSYLMKEANSLTFLYVGSTKMACPDMSVENKFLAMLPKIDNYMIEGNMLHLHKGKRDAFAKFEAIK